MGVSYLAKVGQLTHQLISSPNLEIFIFRP